MTQEELIIQVSTNKHDIEQLNSRMEKVENKQEVIFEISKNVEKLAINMEHMANEQKNIKDRIDNLEKEPIENVKYYKRVAISCIITAIVSGVIGALITLLIK